MKKSGPSRARFTSLLEFLAFPLAFLAHQLEILLAVRAVEDVTLLGTFGNLHLGKTNGANYRSHPNTSLFFKSIFQPL
jgi:hypothetical protein